MNLIKFARKEMRLSQEALEELTGISRWRLHLAESNKRVLNLEQIVKLSDLLEIDRQSLIEESLYKGDKSEK